MIYHRFPVITLITIMICTSAYLILGPASEHLLFDRQLVMDGELFRLLTAHFIHSDINHLLWNMAAMLLLGGLLEQKGSGHVLTFIPIGIISVDLYVIYASDLVVFCGLSGVLNTLLIGALYVCATEFGLRWMAVTTALAAFAKIMFELSSQQALFTQTAWPSIPMTHLFGFVGGVFWLILFNIKLNSIWSITMKTITPLLLILSLITVNNPVLAQSTKASENFSQGTAMVVSGSVAMLSASGQIVIESVKTVGDSTFVVIKSLPDLSKATIRISSATVGASSLVAGKAVQFVTNSVGTMLVHAGEVLAVIPNEIGKALLHQSKY